jgi:hypothetical protein
MSPRGALPPIVWLVLAIASFVAAFGAWQNQRLERLRPPAAAASVPQTETSNPGATPRPAQTPANAIDSAATGAATADAASVPARQADPQAGRQVLRCVTKGRVTYRDLNAGCPEGSAERVTVFPTEGVGKPQ